MARYAVQFSVGICLSTLVVGYTNFVFFCHSVEFVKVPVAPRAGIALFTSGLCKPARALCIARGYHRLP